MTKAALVFALILAGPWVIECQAQTTNSKPTDSKPTDSKPTDSKPTDSKPSRRESAKPRSVAVTAERQQQKLQSDQLRFLQASSDMALRLRGESRDAFERGLLPLADYSSQLALALQMEMAVADLRGRKVDGAAALAAHAGQLEAAAGLLRQFNQPAARGWSADLAQAEMLSAEAAARATTSRTSAANHARTLQLVSAQAQKQYQLRLADFENGLAPLRDLSRAASYMTGDISNPETAGKAVPSLIDYQTTMQQIVLDTEALARRGADGGRIDHVREAQFELNRNSMLLAGLAKDEKALSSAFQAADLAAQELLASQSRLHDSGTVQLFDMAQSMSQWQDLHRQAGQFEFEVPESSNTKQQYQLQRLLQLADQQTDLRGRIAADVTMVHSLKTLTDLRQLEADSDKSVSPDSP